VIYIKQTLLKRNRCSKVYYSYHNWTGENRGKTICGSVKKSWNCL